MVQEAHGGVEESKRLQCESHLLYVSGALMPALTRCLQQLHTAAQHAEARAAL